MRGGGQVAAHPPHVALPGGRRVRWEGPSTGARVLSAGELDALAVALLGVPLGDVPAVAARELEPRAWTPTGGPAVVLHGAASLKGSFETDVASLAAGRPADDFATYYEARAVYLAQPGDLVVGRTPEWREAADLAGVAAVEVPDREHYYLLQALLVLAARHATEPVPAIARIADVLRARPATVVRVFTLDREAQILLVWLRRAAGLRRLAVDANGPEVAERWNQKSSLHPAVEAAAGLPGRLAAAPPGEALAAESALAPLAGLPRLPGYTVARAGDRRDVEARLASAAGLLVGRYGLHLGCAKPSKELSGPRIATGVPLDDPTAVAALADRVLAGEEDWVLEAHATYLRHGLGDGDVLVAPSAHVVGDEVAEGATVQLTQGSAWRGSVYVDERVCERLGLARPWYDAVRAAMGGLVDALRGRGFVKGGVDFAVATVGGRFGDEVLVAMQDPNLSATGADYVRAFLARARAAAGADVYGATKVVRPAPGVGLARLRDASAGAERGAAAIASVPGRWGLVAVAAAEPDDAAVRVLALERRLAADRVLAAVLQ